VPPIPCLLDPDSNTRWTLCPAWQVLTGTGGFLGYQYY
jgi:hypothetical protein